MKRIFFTGKMWGKFRKNPPYGTLLAEKCLKPPRNERFSKNFGIFLPKTWWMWPGPLPRQGLIILQRKKLFFLEDFADVFPSGIFFEEAAVKVNDFGWNWQFVLTLWVLTVQWFVLMISECWQVMVARRSFFEELGQCAAQLAPDFNPQNCSNAAWGLKVLDKWHVDLMHSWSFYLFIWQKHDISVHFLLVHHLEKPRETPHSIKSWVVDGSDLHLWCCEMSLSIQVWAFATVSYVNGELFQATARRASEIAKELVAQDTYGGRRIVRVEPPTISWRGINDEDDSLSLYFFLEGHGNPKKWAYHIIHIWLSDYLSNMC